jgi:hypothetical protein
MDKPAELPKLAQLNPFLTYEAMRTYTDTARFIALVDVAVAAKALEVLTEPAAEIKPTSS